MRKILLCTAVAAAELAFSFTAALAGVGQIVGS